MADMIKFYRGALANLPQVGTNGAIYITNDEGGIYLGTGTGMKRLGDFIQVDAVANLPTDGANASALYYCVAENVLAKWNGSEWIQINKQKTLAELGGVSKSVYDTKMAALEKADTDNATAISGVDTRLQAAEEKLKSVATTEGLGELTDRVTTAEGDIDKLEAAIAEGGSVANAIAEAKKAGTDAAAAAKAAQDTADSKATMAQVEAKDYATKAEAQGYANAKDTAIAEAKKAGDDAQASVNALAGKVGSVPEGKTVVGMIADAKAEATYDDTALAGRVTAVEGDVATIKGDYLKASDKTELSDAIAAEETRAKGIEGGLETRLAAVEADYLTSSDKDDLQAQINTIMNNPDTEGVINSITEFTQYIEDHGEIAEGFRTDIDANEQAIIDEAAAARAAEGVLSGRIDVLEVIDHEAYVAADTALKNELNGEIAKKADASVVSAMDTAYQAADTALSGRITRLENNEAGYATTAQVATAKGEAIADAEAKVKALADSAVAANTAAIATKAAQADLESAVGRIGTAEGKITALETASATHALKTEVEAVQTALDEYEEANDAAVALKANSADVYKKTETFTKEEVNAAIATAVEAAHTWGTF